MSHTRNVCTRSIRVLDYIHTFANHAVFTRIPDDHSDVPARFELDETTFVDMGQPDQITVTIQPHDRLNDV